MPTHNTPPSQAPQIKGALQTLAFQLSDRFMSKYGKVSRNLENLASTALRGGPWEALSYVDSRIAGGSKTTPQEVPYLSEFRVELLRLEPRMVPRTDPSGKPI